MVMALIESLSSERRLKFGDPGQQAFVKHQATHYLLSLKATPPENPRKARAPCLHYRHAVRLFLGVNTFGLQCL